MASTRYARHLDVAHAVVNRVRVVHLVLLHEHTFETEMSGDCGHLAGLIGLNGPTTFPPAMGYDRGLKIVEPERLPVLIETLPPDGRPCEPLTGMI